MTTIVHLSDTHFGTERSEVARAVEQALLAIKPDIITISGDITQRATPSQFRAAKAFLDGLPAALKFVIPGNHDIPLYNIAMRLVDPYRHYRSVFGLREGVWCHGNVGIIGYDATSRWRHTRGRLLENDLLGHIRQARQQLRPDAVLIACAHQPLVVGLPKDQENVLIDAQRIAELFSDNGVDLVLSGHVHWPLIATTEQAFPQLKRSFVLSGAGTAVSARTRPGAPNSFNVIRIDDAAHSRTLHVTLMEYDKDTDRFGSNVEKTFAPSMSGWKLTGTSAAKAAEASAIEGYGATRY